MLFELFTELISPVSSAKEVFISSYVERYIDDRHGAFDILENGEFNADVSLPDREYLAPLLTFQKYASPDMKQDAFQRIANAKQESPLATQRPKNALYYRTFN